MARPESVAKAGFYAIPEHLLGVIASLVEPPPPPTYSAERPVLLDPCAGEGVAVEGLAKVWGYRVSIHAVELEAERFAALQTRCRGRLLHGDTFQVVASTNHRHTGACVMLLNPPYDVDPELKRLEERWLKRCGPWLRDGGALLFVVPHYALAASARTLATGYEDLAAYRFPDDDFAAFRQVVVVGRRRVDLSEPCPDTEARVRGWASNPELLPDLTAPAAPLRVEASSKMGFAAFEMGEMDLAGLLEASAPWTSTHRGTGRLETSATPCLDEGPLMGRVYPVASAPRASHMAAALAAGVFNGCLVSPDPGKPGANLLVKGVFQKDWREIDQKTNKAGEVTAVVEVQQPRLTVVVLDMETGSYHELQSSSDLTDAGPESMTVADLIDRYGLGLMRAMLEQCPVMQADPLELPELLRTPYPAQAAAIRTSVHLLRHGDAATGLKTGVQVQGETGSGKTTVALSTIAAMGALNPLILCPPHMVNEWAEQAAAVLPCVDVRILETVSDVDALPLGQPGRPVLAVLSRERAKLGHALASVRGSRCPECGAPILATDHAKLRAQCKHQDRTPDGAMGRLLLDMVDRVAPAAPRNAHVAGLYPRTAWRRRALDTIRERPAAYWSAALPEAQDKLGALLDPWLLAYHRAWAACFAANQYKVPKAWPLEVWAALDATGQIPRGEGRAEAAAEVARLSSAHRVRVLRKVLYAWALACPKLAPRVVEALLQDRATAGHEAAPWDLAGNLLLLGDPRGDTITKLAAQAQRPWHSVNYSRSHSPWKTWTTLARVLSGETPAPRHFATKIKRTEDGLLIEGRAPGRRKALSHLLDAVAEHCTWTLGPVCGAPLYQAEPSPRRFPLATYIRHHAATPPDFLVIDEAHEYKTVGSAQQVAAQRLRSFDIPTLDLSGTTSNGYASSLFAPLHGLSAAFRRAFDRGETARFTERFGYLKRTVQHLNSNREVVAFGSNSDRYEVKERASGQAPGVLPLLQLQWVMPRAVTLQLEDLGLDLPELHHKVVEITPSSETAGQAAYLLKEIRDAIKRDRSNPELVGKLWGAMAHLPAFLDLCSADTGNAEIDGRREYAIRYPQKVGGDLVALAVLQPPAEVLPKEQWMLDVVRAELAEGRNVMLYATNPILHQRLASLLSTHLGVTAAVLDPSKVQTTKRDAWIRASVVKPGLRVLITNPVCVQTGLNSLVHFSTILWMQNPNCDPTVFAQANGRIHRIGQRLECRIYFPVYAGSLQVQAHKLLLHKVGVVQAVDGLDPEAALRAAGILDAETFSGFSVGRALYDMVERGDLDSWPTLDAPAARAPMKARDAWAQLTLPMQHF